MADAKRDANFRPTLIGVSSADEATPTLLQVDPSTGRLLVDISGSFAKQVEDTEHGSGDEGVMMLAVRKDSPGTMVGTDGDYSPLQVDNDGALRVNGVVPGLSIPEHDYISCSYTGDNLTGVVYKVGGAGGTTVATLAIAYSGSNITSVTKT